MCVCFFLGSMNGERVVLFIAAEILAASVYNLNNETPGMSKGVYMSAWGCRLDAEQGKLVLLSLCVLFAWF